MRTAAAATQELPARHCWREARLIRQHSVVGDVGEVRFAVPPEEVSQLAKSSNEGVPAVSTKIDALNDPADNIDDLRRRSHHHHRKAQKRCADWPDPPVWSSRIGVPLSPSCNGNTKAVLDSAQ